ncbi:bifunctional diguanylate cyclase/phosphodiesterase [Marinicella meishanensis]|uniref:bifunctional diguanylate cyclase/phosphodiesterase n=1 Tax=Marinicella meishanensis TaxID=2873263 RepID=UPI001CBB991D|nr:EAL domain-containing protein [Marinicella sp. NBU2979]
MNAKLKWVLLNLAVAAVLSLCCILAHKYMVKPTLSVTIWPAAGLGVAFIMVWGARIIPGIALGELINSIVLYQVHLDFGWNQMALYDLLLYLTNIFRAVFAGFLVRQAVGHMPQLIHFKTIGKFFLFGAVIPCLLTTVIFVMLLAGAGHYTTDDYFTKGLLWYLGDLMSVLVYTPVVMTLIAQPRSIWRPRIVSVGLPVMAGFLMVFVLFNSFKNYEERRINEIIVTNLAFIESIAEQREFDADGLIGFLQNHQTDLKLDRYKIELARITDAPEEPLYVSTDTLTTRYQNHIHRSKLPLAGMTHQLTITPTNRYFSQESSFGLWLTLFIALSFTGFVGIGMLVLTGRHALTANEVERRTLQLKLLNQRLHESNQNYQRIIEKQPVIFWKVDLGLDKVTYVSQEAEHILGYAVEQWLTEPHFFSKRIHPDDLSMVKDNMLQEHLQEKHVEMEYRIRHADGDYRWFRDVLYIPEDFERSNEVMGMLIDITDKKNDAEKIHHLAFHDALTELPNRQNFQNELHGLIEQAQSSGQFGAVLFLDMDRFKVLNDALGHHFGDQLLLKIAERLRDFDDEFMVMARFGGDEFVLATDCEYDNANDAAVQIIMLAERITQHLAEPYLINDSQHICTVSMGITIYPNKNATVNDIIRQADVAMYRSKEQGRNKVTMYHDSMKKENDKMLYVEQVLRNAVSHDSFILKYQPIVNAERQVVAFESLIRIYNEQQTIFPDEFIPVAEDTDLIQPVGRWVISHACLKINDCDHSISVNVSSKQFHQQGFIMYIDQILQRFEVGPGKLTIELTEGVVVGNLNEIKYKFQRLKDMGVLIAIDDFGTGYSSLEYLRQLPIDYLKIDKSFVIDLTASENSKVIIETIISMAKHLGLQTVAEGVETEAQFTILKAAGCDYFQGYLFGKPGDLMAIE